MFLLPTKTLVSLNKRPESDLICGCRETILGIHASFLLFFIHPPAYTLPITQPHENKSMTHLLQRTVIIISFCLLLGACSQKETLFSEFPGFDQYLEKNQPSDALPSATEQALLTQYRPRIFMAKGQTRFLDFYADYIASGTLYENDELISENVSQALLNRYKNSIQAEFRHQALARPSTPVAYGRVNYDTLEYQNQRYPLTFLSYNMVFAHSGLLKGLSGLQRLAMGVVGDNKDWHQLDHYVGLTIVLHENKPLAVLMQQHNYQTTWLLDLAKNNISPPSTSNLSLKNQVTTLPLPADGRIAVDVAIQSNEVYPHHSELTRHPGVSFVDADTVEFFKTGKNMPMMAGWDITHGQQEQDYTLKFLPTSDAFYTFKGRLGEKRSLPGRDGPPGAQYVTLPALMPWANRLVSGFRPGSVEQEKAKIGALLDTKNFKINLDALDPYKKDFIEAMMKH